ncbi:MAG: hypothetical protein AB2L14_12200 [Candidatus Xenobiia bacterium LiM19]
MEPVLSSKEYLRQWAALIQKIWKSDPLLYPQCSGKIMITGIVNEYETAKKILVLFRYSRNAVSGAPLQAVCCGENRKRGDFNEKRAVMAALPCKRLA